MGGPGIADAAVLAQLRLNINSAVRALAAK
jgi:hypothetical protein